MGEEVRGAGESRRRGELRACSQDCSRSTGVGSVCSVSPGMRAMAGGRFRSSALAMATFRRGGGGGGGEGGRRAECAVCVRLLLRATGRARGDGWGGVFLRRLQPLHFPAPPPGKGAGGASTAGAVLDPGGLHLNQGFILFHSRSRLFHKTKQTAEQTLGKITAAHDVGSSSTNLSKRSSSLDSVLESALCLDRRALSRRRGWER